MTYSLYDNNHNLLGQFSSIYDLEHYVNNLREERGERERDQSKHLSVFDYIKSIGYFWDVVPVQQVAQEDLN